MNLWGGRFIISLSMPLSFSFLRSVPFILSPCRVGELAPSLLSAEPLLYPELARSSEVFFAIIAMIPSIIISSIVIIVVVVSIIKVITISVNKASIVLVHWRETTRRNRTHWTSWSHRRKSSLSTSVKISTRVTIPLYWSPSWGSSSSPISFHWRIEAHVIGMVWKVWRSLWKVFKIHHLRSIPVYEWW